jgi:hypothetical protein
MPTYCFIPASTRLVSLVQRTSQSYPHHKRLTSRQNLPRGLFLTHSHLENAQSDSSDTAIPASFIGELSPDFTKAAICYGLRYMVIFEHACYMQVLYTYVCVAFANMGSELVESIVSHVGNTSMQYR